MSASPLRITLFGATLLAGTLLLGLVPPFGSAADPSTDPTQTNPKSSPRTERLDAQLRDFMRQKLVASNQIMEGLAIDDLLLVREGARQLNKLSASEKWRVSNDPMYRQFSGDFRETTQQLIQAAEAGNVDRVVVKWMDATIGCLDCHRFVRGMHIAQ